MRGINALAPWLAVIIAAISVIYSFGVQSSRIDNLEQQMRETRADASANAKILLQIQLDVTEVKTKMNVLIPTSATERPHGGR